jgi:hypothetical protein
MRARGAARSLTAALAVAALVVSCDGQLVQPTHLDYFRMAGPDEIPPGTNASFKAILDESATLNDVSREAQWISSNPSVLSIEAGLATAHIAGEASVTARIRDRETDAKLVMVVPPGTYRLQGRVLQPSSLGVFLARVEVPAAGLSTTTDNQGRYTLYGVPADAELRVTKDGYAPAAVSVHLQDHKQQIVTSMRPVLSGTYTLSISPGTCSSGPPLPPHLLQRTYTVAFVQSGTQVQGTFPGADITVVNFSGTLVQAQWSFDFVIGEQLPDGNVLTFSTLTGGRAVVPAESLAGEFTGRIALNHPASKDALARCEASRFRFALAR